MFSVCVTLSAFIVKFHDGMENGAFVGQCVVITLPVIENNIKKNLNIKYHSNYR